MYDNNRVKPNSSSKSNRPMTDRCSV